MTEEKLAALLKVIMKEAGLQEMIKRSSNSEEVVALVREAGIDISNADLQKLQEKLKPELSDAELERISGGADPDTFWDIETNPNYRRCQPAPEDDGG